MNIAERETLIKAIKVVCTELEGELQARTGYSPEEYNVLLEKIKENNSITGILAVDEFKMLRQVFAELIYGFNLTDFEAKLGVTREVATAIFVSLDTAVDKINIP